MLTTIGRVLFALLFIFSGALQVLDVEGAAKDVAAKVIPNIPDFLSSYMGEIEQAASMSSAQLVTYFAGGLQIICGLMIALNLGARFFAVLLIPFVIILTYFMHDFWNQSGAERLENIVHVLKNISIIGALLLIIGHRPVRMPTAEPIYHDRVAL